MGDASFPPLTAPTQEDHSADQTIYPSTNSTREVNILVTGFGSFKSFTVNPSWLVASNLSRYLAPESQFVPDALKNLRHLVPQHPVCAADSKPYRIKVHVYPDPLRVAYDVVREVIPPVISDPSLEAATTEASLSSSSSTTQGSDGKEQFMRPPGGYDYVLHIGLAAGRENYTLETLAHRDNYKLKDVDDKDGLQSEKIWRDLGLPEVIDVGWNKEDVLARWEALTTKREEEHEEEEMVKLGWKRDGAMSLVETAKYRSRAFLGKGKRAMVKLSRDAGRYLCEFIFYTSLGTRWQEARDEKDTEQKKEPAIPQQQQQEQQGIVEDKEDESLSKTKLGKVAFLHVPAGTETHDIARGIRVAESLILAFVGSWEDGYRNPNVYSTKTEEQQQQQKGESTPADLYEVKGTGDR